jgi:nickel transport protein
MIRPLRVAAALTLATTASAHQLNVFAWVDGSEVVVEGKFSNGRVPQAGTITVYDAADKVLRTLEVGEDGTARFPLAGGEDGLRIELFTGEGHEDYWILTPGDLAGQAGQ